MEIRILETGELKELNIYTYNGFDFFDRLVEDYVKHWGDISEITKKGWFYYTPPRNEGEAPIYLVHLEDFTWWEQYIKDFKSDEEEIWRLSSDLLAEYPQAEFEKILNEFTEEAYVGPLDLHHDTKQAALRKFRRHYLDEDED